MGVMLLVEILRGKISVWMALRHSFSAGVTWLGALCVYVHHTAFCDKDTQLDSLSLMCEINCTREKRLNAKSSHTISVIDF